MKEVISFLKVFGDETRLRVLNILFAEDDICVCDLVNHLSIPQGSVSRHLKLLRSSNLVTVRVDSNWRYYSLNTNISKGEKELLNAVKLLCKDNKFLRKELQEFSKSKCGELL